MKTLFWGNILFAAALLVHFLVWKLALPRRQAKALGIVLLLVPSSGLAALALFPALPFRPQTGPEYANLVLYLAAFCLAYLITYSAVEVDSPSLAIVRRIASQGGRGLPLEELYGGLNDRELSKPRIADLVTDGMASLESGRYALTAKGAALAWVFANFRKLLKLGKGG